MEIWKDILEYEGLYQASSLGRIKSMRYGRRILKTYFKRGGYLGVSLCSNGVEKKYSVHRLVGIAFLPNPQNKPQINHKNLIRTDNRLENLEWATAKENIMHAIENNVSFNKKGIYLKCANCNSAFPLDKFYSFRNLKSNIITYQSTCIGCCYLKASKISDEAFEPDLDRVIALFHQI